MHEIVVDEVAEQQARQEKSVQDIIDNSMDMAFKQKMAMYTLIGDLTSWRTNMKNNSRREQVINGRAKILSFVDRCLS